MTSGDWHAAWRIFELARELPAEDQAAFVEAESANAELAAQVFEMLAQLAEEESQQPEVLRSTRTGMQIGRYEVEQLVGRGGVGEVYAARDTDLGRRVALKFLRPESIGDPAAVKRFIREAKAASALNHPNILTIHEVIDSNEGLAIAMEFVEGDNLSSVRGVAQPAERVIRIGQQIGEALAAAHEAGLIHRDIKPENILVRRDGYVKIVDFGLARRPAGSGQHSKAAVPPVLQPGPNDTVATGFSGTLRYMSPEQARGEEISTASDIFSFGLVLYELATGQHAFPGDSPMATVEAILSRAPAAPSTCNEAVSPELDRLILRMLAGNGQARPGAAQVAGTLADMAGVRGVPRGGVPRVRLWGWAVGAAALLTGMLGFWQWGVWQSPWASRPATLPEFRQVTTLTAENRATAAVISPDGKWTAYANADGIFVQPTESNVPRALQAPANLVVDRLGYSGDGSRLLASGFSTAANTPEVWIIEVAGGAPRLLRPGARGASFSADGKQVAFISEDRSEIWVMDSGGAGARKVMGGREELFLLVFWSPDGKRLSYQRRRLWAETDIPNPEADTVHASRYESAEVSTGRILAQVPGMPISTAAPLPDGRLIFIRSGTPSGEKWSYISAGRTVWEVKTNPATGAFVEEPRKIAEVERRTALQSLSATADGRRIMVVRRTDQSAVFVADFEKSPPRMTKVRRIILDEGKNYPHAWTRDSRTLIFESGRNGNSDLFRQSLDQRTPEPIIATSQIPGAVKGGWSGLEQLAPDGRTVLFAYSPDPRKPLEFRLMRVPLEGGTPEFVPLGGPGGPPRDILDEFRCAVGGRRCVLRTAIAGQSFAFHELDPVRGKGRQLASTGWSRNILGDWDLSPDGMDAAIPNHFSREARIRVVSLRPGENGTREREVAVPGLSDLKGAVWAADRSGWFVTSDTELGVQMFFVFPDGRFHSLGDISGWAVPAPDGRQVAFTNWTTASNVWVLDRQGK